jgi:uncharacterized membrane protein YccF (DUF307 family)
VSAIGNLLWLLFGGLVMGFAWWLVGLLCFVSIIGIPWGRACFVIGQLCFLPFGRSVADRRVVTGRADVGTGALGVIGNVLWFLFAGLWLAIGHLVSAVVCFVTIVGIPFGIQHLKLAEIALAPIGKTIVLNRR